MKKKNSWSIDWLFLSVVLLMMYIIMWDIIVDVANLLPGVLAGIASMIIHMVMIVLMVFLFRPWLGLLTRTKKYAFDHWSKAVALGLKILIIGYLSYPFFRSGESLAENCNEVVVAMIRDIDHDMGKAIEFRFNPFMKLSDKRGVIGSRTFDADLDLDARYTAKLCEDPIIQASMERRVAAYHALKTVRQSSYRRIMKGIRKSMRRINKQFDWQLLETKYLQSDHRKVLAIKRMYGLLSPEDAMTVIFNEMYGSGDSLTVGLLDAQARIGGEEYLDLIPNKDPAFGLYQHNQVAVDEIISRYNQFFPKRFWTPKSILQLAGDQHHELFWKIVIARSYLAVKRLSLDELDKTSDRDLRLYLLAAHNDPAQALRGLKGVVRGKDFLSSITDPDVREYVRRLQANNELIAP